MSVKLSIGTWAYTFDDNSKQLFSIEDLAFRLGKLGFDGVALSGFKPQAHYELYSTKKARRQLEDLFNSNGLEINCYAADLKDYPFYTGIKDEINNYEEAFDRCLELCVDCEIPVIRIDTVAAAPYSGDFDYSAIWDRVVEMFKKNARKAGKSGKMVVWEFEPGFIFNKPSEILKMVKDVGMDNFKLQYDTCHAQMCAVAGTNHYGEKEVLKGGQLELLEILKGMIGDVHLIDSDNTLRDIRNSTHAPFGKGLIDFEKLIPAFERAGYTSEWWTIDIGARSDAWELTEHSIKYLDVLFKKLDMKK